MFSGQACVEDSNGDLVLFKTISNWKKKRKRDFWASDCSQAAIAWLLWVIPSHPDQLMWRCMIKTVLIYLRRLFLQMCLTWFGCKAELAVVSRRVQQRGELDPCKSRVLRSQEVSPGLQPDCACRAHPKPLDPRGSWASTHQRGKVRSREGFKYSFLKRAWCTNDRNYKALSTFLQAFTPSVEYVSTIHLVLIN